MNAKYYTHFVAREPGSASYDEYRGVIELRSPTWRIYGEHKIAQMLAERFDLEEDEIKILEWQQLH
jgi:hypothetical protein